MLEARDVRDGDFTILDYIDSIKVPGKVFEEPANEYWALICLHQGLEFLYQQAARCDQVVLKSLNPKIRVLMSGSCPELAGVSQSLLTCAFHWYAVSACQYVRTVGAIARRYDKAQPLPKEYACKVIPEVVAFRDKVAAHFAWTTKNKEDNEAERDASIMPQLSFVDDSFFVSAFTIGVRQSGEASDSSAMKPWSISKVHQQLRLRYWPPQCDGGAINEA